MLLNLSNHPSTHWSPEQLQAAHELYAGVQDMSFPQIDPEATSKEVRKLASAYLKAIKAREEINAVHLMGEMTFVVALATMLRKAKISVVCSTTQRTVLEEVDGRKTTQFKFVQFRSYV